MKELSIEQKAQRYDEAIKVAENIHRFSSDLAEIKRIEQIFPELEESEGERIRKEIIDFIKKRDRSGCDYDYDKWIAWLEKQGKRDARNKYLEELLEADTIYQMAMNDAMVEEAKNKAIKALQELAVSKLLGLEKQGEQKSYSWKPTKEQFEALDYAYNSCSDTERGNYYEGVLETLIEDLHRLEKQGEQNLIMAKSPQLGEQKSADKVEPKFRDGDWIVYKDTVWKVCNISLLNYYELLKINNEVSTRFIKDVDETAHLWTIQDAKDGDVLINWNNTIFIFKAIEDETVKFHIAYNEKWDAIKTPSTKLSHLGLPEPQFEFHPATKEQRDTLFAKMHESGYEWDDEKKESKKIKAEYPLCSTIKEKIQSYIFNHFTTDKVVKTDVKSIVKAMEEGVRLGKEQISEWSEEDEDMLYKAIAVINRLCAEGKEYVWSINTLKKLFYWLKSLRP